MLTKIVNGQEVECSAEEEAEIRAEWDANDVLIAAQVAAAEAEAMAKESALSKLSALGLTEDEVKALLGAK
jgi:hypothetical protein